MDKLSHTVDVVVIGGGQAGLALGWHLQQNGLDFLILGFRPNLGFLTQLPVAGRLVSTSGTFNVLVTLTLGLLVAWGVQHRTIESLVLAGGAILAAYLLSEPLMFGFSGVFVPAALVLAIKRPNCSRYCPSHCCQLSNWPV